MGEDGTENNVWDFQGVFSSREKAVAACRDERYFVGPAELDEPLPNEQIEWSGCFWPTKKEREDARKES